MSEEKPDFRIAERYHDRAQEILLRLNEATISSANAALRAALIINGGAAITILAFIGNLISNNPENRKIDMNTLTGPIEWFAWGVAASVTAMAFAYFANYSYVGQVVNIKESYEYPFNIETKSSKRWKYLAKALHLFAIILVD